jgi:hypothetical protein
MGVMKLNTETINDSAVNSVSPVMGNPEPSFIGDVKSSVTITKGETQAVFVETENLIVGDVLINETRVSEEPPVDTAVTYTELPEVTIQEAKLITCTKTISDSSVAVMGAVIAGTRIENIYDNTENNKHLPAVHALKIFPNPVHRGSTAKADVSNLPAGAYKLELADMGGRILYSNELMVDKSALVEIPVSGLPGGMYMLRFRNKNSGKVFSEKIIVQ